MYHGLAIIAAGYFYLQQNRALQVVLITIQYITYDTAKHKHSA